MVEKICEPVTVLASFQPQKSNVVKVTPHKLVWRGRQYKLDTFGLYHPERRGNKRLHIFSFSCDSTFFRVELDPDTLEWTLAEIYYET